MQTNTCNNCECKNRITNKYCTDCGYELPKIEVQPVVELQPVKSNKKVVWSVIVGAIVGVAAMVVAVNMVQKIFMKPSLNTVMLHAASELNKSCPLFVDSETRLDNVTTLPNDIFQYNYTLVNLEVGNIDTLGMKEALEPNILNIVKTNPDMKFVRDNKATLSYYYKDKNGKYVCRILMPYERYK